MATLIKRNARIFLDCGPLDVAVCMMAFTNMTNRHVSLQIGNHMIRITKAEYEEMKRTVESMRDEVWGTNND